MKLACKDINPATTCNFEVTGGTVPEVAAKMLAHAKADHSADIEGKSDTELLSMMGSKVHA